MWAETKGFVQKSRELYYEICGTEIATVLNQGYVYNYDFLYWSEKKVGTRYNTIDLVPMRE